MKNFKRIAALAVVVIWGILLIVTLVVSFMNTEESRQLFNGLIVTDIALPVVAYAMILIAKILKGRHQ